MSEPIYATAAGWRIELLPPLAYQARFTATGLVVGFAYHPQCGSHAIGSDRIAPFVRKAGTIACVPEGCDIYSESVHGGEYLALTSTDRRLDQSAGYTANRPTLALAGRGQIAAATALRSCLLGAGSDDLFMEQAVLCMTAASIADSELAALTTHGAGPVNARSPVTISAASLWTADLRRTLT